MNRGASGLPLILLMLWLALTATPRIPILWDQLDPLFFLWADGDWMLVDSCYYLLTAIACLDLARRWINPGDWPWAVIMGWGGFAIWSFASCFWSPFPRFSLHEWAHDNLLTLAAFALGYAAIASRALRRRDFAFASIVMPIYLVIGYVFLFREKHWIAFDVGLTSTWLAYLFPMLFWWFWREADNDDPKRLFLPAFTLIACQAIAFFAFPQRMVVLALFVIVCLILLAMYRYELIPRKTFAWRAGNALLLGYLVLSYLLISRGRPASYLAGEVGGDSYLQVFVKSERYEIFRYWFDVGAEHVWTGVGLGWQVPALVYNHRYLADTPLNSVLFSHGHNVLINTWLQLGIVGVVLLVAWYSTVVRIAARQLVSGSALAKGMSLALLGLVAVFLLRNLSDDGHREGNPVLLWGLIGGSLGYLRLLQSADRKNFPEGGRGNGSHQV